MKSFFYCLSFSIRIFILMFWGHPDNPTPASPQCRRSCLFRSCSFILCWIFNLCNAAAVVVLLTKHHSHSTLEPFLKPLCFSLFFFLIVRLNKVRGKVSYIPPSLDPTCGIMLVFYFYFYCSTQKSIYLCEKCQKHSNLTQIATFT